MATTNTSSAAETRRSATLNTLIVAGGYLLSRILGLVREIIIASRFGTEGDISAFRAAFTIPDLIYLVIAGGALGSAFIPIFSGFIAERRSEDAWRLASTIFNLMSLGVIIVSALIALFAEPIVALTIGSGFSPELQALTVTIVRLLLIQTFLLGVAGLGKATLESFDRFTLPVVGSLLYNIGIIAGAAFLAPSMQIYGLVLGVIIGAVLFVLVQLPGLFAAGMRYSPALRLDVPGVGDVARLIGPRLFGQAVAQINLIAIASFASQISEQATAANYVAYQLMLLPHGLIALSVGTVIFPQLSRAFAAGELSRVRELSAGALNSILFLAIPAAVALAILDLPVLELLFQHGEFGPDSAALAAQALGWYALGLPAYAAAEIVIRTFYAMRDTRTPVAVGVAAVALNIVLSWAFVRLNMNLAGLALAFSMANLFEFAMLLLLLGRRVGGLGMFASAFARMLLAAGGFAGVLWLLLQFSTGTFDFLHTSAEYQWQQDFLPLALWLLAVVAVSGGVYFGLAALLRIPETAAFTRRAQRLLRR